MERLLRSLSENRRAQIRRRIVERSIPVPMCGCWLWVGGYGSHGYGAFRVGSKMTTAPRASFLAWNGELRRREDTRHTCDSKWCVNPDHLVRGSRLENMRDWATRRESARKLTVDIVTEIKARIRRGDKVMAISRDYDVNHATIRHIRLGISWAHVP